MYSRSYSSRAFAANDKKFADERSKELNIGETNWEAPADYKGHPVKWDPEAMKLI